MLDRKRKKHHDKDKYYRLAKEQGLRSRAAFKLSQINRKFPVLERATTAVIDLCAAPGGWTQIAARTCRRGTKIIAVDILPVRSIPGFANTVTTLIGDITTDKCKADIRRCLQQQELQQQQNNSANAKSKEGKGLVDVVLHDGAPNIGADYGKDAYEQNEMVLHALRVATHHLKPDGTFITKVYRSRDYASIQWVVSQLFHTVTTFKPKASREQSSEIFLICQNYKAPINGVDSKLLDPKYIFEHVDGTTDGSDMKLAGIGPKGNMTVFDKNWNKHVRKRGGYDLDHLNFTMRHDEPVLDFISSTTSTKEAIAILSRSTGLKFNVPSTKTITNKTDEEKDTEENDDDDDDENTDQLLSAFVQNHPLTTVEIKESLADLQVLNKADFKALLQWRVRMQDAIQARKDEQDEQTDMQSVDNDNDHKDDDDNNDKELDSDAEEEMIQGEIEAMKLRRQKERKRKLKKERALAAKRRRQAALGMDLNAFDITADNDQQIFSLATITSSKALAQASEVNLDTMTDEQIFGTTEEQDDDIVIPGKSSTHDSDADDDDDDGDVVDDKAKLQARRQQELDEAYDLYLQTTKDGLAKSGTKMAKRSKKLQREKVINETLEDQEMIMNTEAGLSYDAETYAKILTKSGGDSDDDDDSDDDADDDDDGANDEPMTPAEHAAKQKLRQIQQLQAANARSKVGKASKTKERNPLIHEFEDNEPVSAKTSRWFSNPLFATIGKAVADSVDQSGKKKSNAKTVSDDDDNDGDDKDSNKGTTSKSSNKLTADDVLAMMPKTDKQKRHEKRLKQMEKDQWKEDRRKKRLGDNEGELQLVPADYESTDDDDDKNNSNGKNDSDSNKKMRRSNMKGRQDKEVKVSAEKKKILKEAEMLIKAGMGGGITTSGVTSESHNSTIEIVPQDKIPNRPVPVIDDRKYDSDNMEYDSDDYAETLAIGTMIVRSKSKEKTLVDASYNRYAWNDPDELPDWFVDDEKKHYRPQLPVPPALVAKMKQQMLALSVKPIKKVAEARARKNKRAKLKLAAAKKKAEAVAQSTDMSEAMKLKAISKALQTAGSKDVRKPGKQYVIAKKGRALKGAKGMKVVDKRLICDTRAQKRIDQRKKNGGKLPKKRGRR